MAAAANQNGAGQLENPRQYSVATSDRYRKLRSDPRLRKQRAFCRSYREVREFVDRLAIFHLGAPALHFTNNSAYPQCQGGPRGGWWWLVWPVRRLRRISLQFATCQLANQILTLWSAWLHIWSLAGSCEGS